MTAPAAKKAAKKVLKTKVEASQATKKAATSTARASAKSAQRAADRELRIQRVQAAKARVESAQKTSGPGSPKKMASSAPRDSGAPARKKPAAQRAVSSSKQVVERRVETAKESRRKTASAVESKYRREKVLGLAEMRPKTRMLAAEYMGAIVMAIIMLFLHDGEKTYHQRMSRFFIQMTGITGIFFVLALASSSEKASRYAVPFGLLIDVSMLIYLFKQGGANVINRATGVTSDEYNQILESEAESAAHPARPTLIAPGLIITPGSVATTGGTIGGPVAPNIIMTPGTSRVPGIPQ